MIDIVGIADLPKLSKRILPEFSVVARIESLLEDMNVDPITVRREIDLSTMTRRRGIYHASTIGSTKGQSLCGKYPMGCAREMFYDLTAAKKEGSWEPRFRRILDTGTAVHAQLQGYLAAFAERSGETFEPEADIDPDKNEVAGLMDISGHTDGIYTFTAGELHARFAVEIKTINDAGFKKTNGPHPEHIMQGTVYQKCLDLPVIVFLYYNKNDSSMLEFPHIFDVKRWEAIQEKLSVIRDMAMSNKEPDREAGYHCAQCGYKGICNPPQRVRGAAIGRAFR